MADNQIPNQDPQKDARDLAAVLETLRELNAEWKALAQTTENFPGFGTALESKNLEEINKLVGVLQERVYDLEPPFQKLASIFKGIGQDLGANLISDAKKSFSKLESLSAKLRDHSASAEIQNLRQLRSITRRSKAEIENLKEVYTKLLNPAKALKPQEEVLKKQLEQLFEEQNGRIAENKERELAEYLEQQEKLLKNEEKLQKSIGITGNLFKGATKIFGKLGFETDSIENSLLNIRDAAKVGTWKAFKTGLKEVAILASDAFKDPIVKSTILLGLTKQLIKAGLFYSDLIAGIGRSYGLTGEAAETLGEYTRDFAKSSTNIFATQKNIVEAQQQINAAYGTAVVLSKDLTEGQIDLTKRLELTAEEASGLTSYALFRNQTQEELLLGITKENKGILSNKKVLQEVVKASGQLAAFYKNNPILLARAVVQAQKLGLTLEQTKSITSKLLDFESSITSQMEAEVLVGRTLELNKARSLALQGKTAEAAAEMLKQVGGLNRFQNLNRIQQESLAGALGMSADELADSLFKQEMMTKLTASQRKEVERLRKEGKGELADKLLRAAGDEKALKLAEAQISAQARFNAAVDKLKDTFTAIVEGPLGKIVTGLAKAAEWVGTLLNKLGGIGQVLTLGLGGLMGGKLLGLGGMLGGLFGGGGGGEGSTGGGSAPRTGGSGGFLKGLKSFITKPKLAMKGLFKGGFKSLLKKIPGVGLITGGLLGIGRLLKRDWKGALGEIASGAAGTIPGLGTAVSFGIDAALGARDASSMSTTTSGGNLPGVASRGRPGIGGLLRGLSTWGPLGASMLMMNKVSGSDKALLSEVRRLAEIANRHTSILEAIRSKELVVKTDELAYAVGKATPRGYGNLLNTNSGTS